VVKKVKERGIEDSKEGEGGREKYDEVEIKARQRGRRERERRTGWYR
jgi:hypothetical protein